ncbi:hypothetical protein [Labrenzia sp. OB1]|uniref:hypothetical protein n=1 Tax=Labrenzia sp. OB1 TaxID=1561204 RepID=UPI0007B2A9BD|nr:hypothetical protein [Labrenzia sp. OB1]KZM51079.1 hypothetical protein OA90_05210 [Labrenzia sp. OB1]
MPAARLDLPSNYTAVHVIGVTRGANKMRPTIYFATGSHFTQSHRKQDNIGYHPPPGRHLFFGNVDAAALDKMRKALAGEPGNSDRRAFGLAYYRSLITTYTDDSGRACDVGPPLLGQNRDGLVLLEVTTEWSHRSRASLEPVSYQESVSLIRDLRSRTITKHGPHRTTREYYFADSPDS